MIDPITQTLLNEYEQEEQELQEELSHILEGYDLHCQQCGRVISVIKDGQGPLSCCNQRMFVMGSNPMDTSTAMEESEEYEIEDIAELLMLEKEALKKALAKLDRWGKEGIIIKHYAPVQGTKEIKKTKPKKLFLSKEQIELLLQEREEQLQEFKKTRGVIGRALKSITDPAYAQRKKDLMKLKKKTTGSIRKKLERNLAASAKRKPEAYQKLKSGKAKLSDPIKAALARRFVAKRVGGYEKAEKLKSRGEAQAKEKAQMLKKSQKEKERKEKEFARQEYKKKLDALKRKYKSGKKQLKSQPAKKPTTYRKPSAPRTSRPAKKEFSGGGWMSLESQLLKDMEVFEEIGVRRAIKGEVVKPDFQVKTKDVHFSPYNQSDAQKNVEKERDVKKKVPYNQDKTEEVSEGERERELKQFLMKQKGFKSAKDQRRYKNGYSQYGSQKRAPESKKQAERDVGSEKTHVYISRRRKEQGGKPYKMDPQYGPSSKDWRSKHIQVGENEEFVDEAGFETKPKGWTDQSVKKFGKSLVKGGGTKKGFFDKCVKKMEGKVANPEGFCAAVKDEAHDSTYWRGKDKSPQEVGKDVKKHKNV